MRVIKRPLLMTRKTIRVIRGIQEDSEAEDCISFMGVND